MKVVPNGEPLGASIEGLDLANPLQPAQLDTAAQRRGARRDAVQQHAGGIC